MIFVKLFYWLQRGTKTNRRRQKSKNITERKLKILDRVFLVENRSTKLHDELVTLIAVLLFVYVFPVKLIFEKKKKYIRK